MPVAQDPIERALREFRIKGSEVLLGVGVRRGLLLTAGLGPAKGTLTTHYGTGS